MNTSILKDKQYRKNECLFKTLAEKENRISKYRGMVERRESKSETTYDNALRIESQKAETNSTKTITRTNKT